MRMNFQNMKQGLCRLRGEEEERGRGEKLVDQGSKIA